ncbi:MAG TPA: ATP-binding protein [Anaeromyxobacteraceae bacterium]|nr:ATP-binding protein [Anaeromyxobacteraceae bacterium]
MTAGPWPSLGSWWTTIALLAGPWAVLAFAIGLTLLHRAQRRRDLNALRQSEERLRFAIEATTEVVWDWNLDEDSMYCPRWARAYGYPEAVTPRTGKDLFTYVHADDVPVIGEQLKGATEGTRSTLEFEHRVRTGSGEWMWMLARAHVVARDERGRATRIVGTCADITERKRMLARLQIADRMASVGTLAAGVAHEINNPLAYVIGNVDYAHDALGSAGAAIAQGRASTAALGKVVAECRQALHEAQDGADRVRRIVRDLKVLSRAEEDERVPVCVGRVVQAALNLGDAVIRSRARLVTDLADVPPVMGNESRLTQVFLNLIVNAAQAIPEGQAERNEIFVGAGLDGRGQVVVEVRDSGCGIPPENRDRIFDPFFTTKPVGVGTGLGLAICHGIVAAFGGEIEVESEVGKGSTFRVSLPPSADLEPVAAASPPLHAPRRGRILVVDDEPLFCQLVERVLRPEHEVVAVSDPRDALRRVQDGERFDLVLTDLAMPGLNGVELHAELSRIAPDLAAGMLFVTGGAFTRAAADFVATRPERVLDKPISPDAVRAAVAEALQRRPERTVA